MWLDAKGETLLESYISILIFGIIVLAVSSIIMGANRINTDSNQKMLSFNDTLNIINTGTPTDINNISSVVSSKQITVKLSEGTNSKTQIYTPSVKITDNGLISVRKP